MKEREVVKKVMRSKSSSRKVSSAMGIMTEIEIVQMLQKEENEKKDKLKQKEENIENKKKRKAEKDLEFQQTQEAKAKKKIEDEERKKEEQLKKAEETQKKKEASQQKKEENQKKKEENQKKKEERDKEGSKRKKGNKSTENQSEVHNKCKDCDRELLIDLPDRNLWRTCEKCPNWFCGNCCAPEFETCRYC
jgi:hypothetical protein